MAYLVVEDEEAERLAAEIAKETGKSVSAKQAFLKFGKGRHPAGMDFGDCFTYALAKATREPLLFKATISTRPI